MKPFAHGVTTLVFYGWNLLMFLQSFAQEFAITPSTVILFPGDTSAVFACQLSSGVIPLWQVNGVSYTLAGLSNGELSGHNVSGTNITVSVPMNGTKYVCVIPAVPPNPTISSNPAFLYIAGAPEMVTDIMINLQSVKIVDSSVNFTMTWTEPFANFDPIVDYTITIHCTNATLCPAVFNADNVVTNLFVNITTDLSVMNFISTTASNTIGTSAPAIRIIVAPSQVDMVVVDCAPLDMINQCNITWNAITYGPNVIPSPLFYLVKYSGNNFMNDVIPTEDTFITINLPPVDSVFNVFVSAVNVFGTGPKSDTERIIINSPSVTNATILLNASNTFGYSITVICAIHLNSRADQCVVMAMADGRATITGAAPITNGTATVIVDGLECEVTYTITAGGTLNGDLVGPRSSHGNITTGPCPVMTTTTTTKLLITAITTTKTTKALTQPTPVPTADGDSGSSDNAGAIIGALVGGIVGAVLITLLLFVILYCYCCRHEKFKKESKAGCSVTNPTYSSTAIYEEIDIKMEPYPSYSEAGAKDTPRYVPSQRETNVVPSPSEEANVVPSPSEEANVVPTQSEEVNVVPSPSEETNAAKDNESYHEYEDIVSDLHIKMTRNPSYSIP